MVKTRVPPIGNGVPIVNPTTGAPTSQFIQIWQQLFGNVDAIDGTDIIAGTGLTGGGPLSDDVTIGLGDTAVAPGVYGDATNSPQITVDQQGRLTNVVNVPIASGGGGGFTDVRLATDFSTTSTTQVNVTGLNFTPAANKTYAISGILLVRSDGTSTGVRPGFTVPTGMTDVVISYIHPLTTASGTLFFNASNANLVSNAITSMGPSVVGAGVIEGVMVTGATPSGNLQVTLASETGVNVTIRAGSFLSIREIT